MKKILIIGSSGAGKSTFARRLGAATGLTVVHLDQLYWKPNWVEPSKDEWKETVAEVLENEAWIIDGNYSGTLDLRMRYADAIIFLDFPPTICVWRVLKRVAIYRRGKRPDMPAGCDERFDWDFVKLTWNYPTRSKPRVESLLNNCQDKIKVIRLKSNREIENFFANLKSNRVESI
ncbi:MAG: DNA topology modulation protein [Acidobacteriota bacterium]|nr:DNA topology modulation protein [Acidobacteriota bacterium]